MKLVLHNYWRSSASYRVRIALGIKELAYDYAVVNIIKDGGQQHSVEFKAHNPMAQVPTLEVNEDVGHSTFLSQSLPIIEYLDERWPHLPLLPRGATHAAMAARAAARGLAELVNSGIQPLQNLSTTNRVKALGGDERAWVAGFIASGLAALEAAVATTSAQFCVGDAVTIADCCLIPQLYSARRFGVALDPFPRLRAIEAACDELPAFAAAHPDRQPDAVA
jgi:maleylpyruvate isomerase